jgi:hypothetical protein
MPTREEADIKVAADRAMRAGRPEVAWPMYLNLLGRVHVFEAGLYESWLEGAYLALQALQRPEDMGAALLGLRRFAEAQRFFPERERPVEWALCASRLGRHDEAARVLIESGHPALAAMELENERRFTAAREAWKRALADPRLEGRRYEEALIHVNLARLGKVLEEGTLLDESSRQAQRGLEELADEFETHGERERAFDCYGVLLYLGRETGAFENVSEGYLNAIRLLAADDQRFFVLQYYEDFLAYAAESGELEVAAMLAREAADFSARAGFVYDRGYLSRAAGYAAAAARAHLTAGRPVELAEHAFAAAVDAAASLGDLEAVAGYYGELAALDLPEKKRARYRRLGERAKAARTSDVPTLVPFPDYLRRPGAYQEIWRLDLVEWELGGDPRAVLARLAAEKGEHVRFARLAVRALLQIGATPKGEPRAEALVELVQALGRIQVYEVLRPLEDLFLDSSAQVRAAVMTAAGQVYCRRSFALVQRGLADPVASVQGEALRALRGLRFRDGLEPLQRIFRSAEDGRVRLAALETIADIASLEAGLFLIEIIRGETETLRNAAAARLAAFPSDELAPHVQAAWERTAPGPVRDALGRVVAGLGRLNAS